jgi:phage-related protein
MAQTSLKPVRWVPLSYEELVAFPRDVQHAIGLALMMGRVLDGASVSVPE